jgi:hypothetical protein
MRSRLLPSALIGLCLAAASCAGPARSALSEPRAGHAECPVCRCEGDLACVDVVIGGDTPSAVVGGTTYYFCSESCRDDFLSRPERFDSGSKH